MNNNTLAKKGDFSIIPNTTEDIKNEIRAYGENIDGLINYVSAVNYSKSALQLRFCGVFRAMQDPNYLKNFGEYDNFKSFLDENKDYFDVTVSTASEMAKYWRIFKETINKNAYVKEYFDVAKPTYTEGIELIKVSKQKGKSADDVEILNDIEAFLKEYAPKHQRSWSTMASLRNIIKIYNGAISVNQINNNEKPETPKPTGDKNTVISVDDLNAKTAKSIVKSLKETGDLTENKVKNTTTFEADTVEQFMNRLVALAKDKKVKPMDIIAHITCTINWTDMENKEGE